MEALQSYSGRGIPLGLVIIGSLIAALRGSALEAETFGFFIVGYRPDGPDSTFYEPSLLSYEAPLKVPSKFKCYYTLIKVLISST